MERCGLFWLAPEEPIAPLPELHTRADRLSAAWRKLIADMADSEMKHAAFVDN